MAMILKFPSPGELIFYRPKSEIWKDINELAILPLTKEAFEIRNKLFAELRLVDRALASLLP